MLATSVFPPTLSHQIPPLKEFKPSGNNTAAVIGAAQLALSADDLRLFVAAYEDAIVLGTALAVVVTASSAVVGVLTSTTATQNPRSVSARFSGKPRLGTILVTEYSE